MGINDTYFKFRGQYQNLLAECRILQIKISRKRVTPSGSLLVLVLVPLVFVPLLLPLFHLRLLHLLFLLFLLLLLVQRVETFIETYISESEDELHAMLDLLEQRFEAEYWDLAEWAVKKIEEMETEAREATKQAEREGGGDLCVYKKKRKKESRK